ncbi:flagellar motor switch protein FliN [Novosphingobium beihaiensis]|uniref:Flagellar motor switch protein FliN n=1 Tax=Novosphingobium beihaiensis TaxID=2930389 RepID=A0ABT0BPS0_9SPHN|nr:flagellar motor switch protein FliN [Novosphingobium beihaiensis]MCJ2186858.1 flagellar motor switch protein FliN [Novosphingobium beihaiensis]
MTMHSRGLEFLRDVDVRLSVELGRTQMKLKEVLALGPESLVVLDRLTDELLDVLVNGKPIAKGEVVSHNGRFGLRIVEMVGVEENAADDASVSLPDSDAGITGA